MSVARLTHVLAYHQALLSDVVRIRAFHRALAARVRPGSRVLDLGAGSGIWAVAAARLGARRVVAVEKEGALAPLIQGLARENGVAERVEVLVADARRIRLPRAFDVVVSETIGNEAFDEGIVPLLARARDRFLRPGGALIPEWIALRGAPVARIGPRVPRRMLATRTVSELTEHVPRVVAPDRLRTLAPSRELMRVDLHAVEEREGLPLGFGRFRVEDGRAVEGFLVWVVAGLAAGVRLSTRAGTTWSPVLLPAGRLAAGPGVLTLELDWNPRRRHWRYGFLGRQGEVMEHRAPLFAWAALAARRHTHRRA